MSMGLGRFTLAAFLIGLLVFVGLAWATAFTQVPARIIILCIGLAALTGLSLWRLTRIPVLANRLQHLFATLAIGTVAIGASVKDVDSAAVVFVVAFLALMTMAVLARDVAAGSAGVATRPWNGEERRSTPAPEPERDWTKGRGFWQDPS